jgi:WD40 repeat protein
MSSDPISVLETPSAHSFCQASLLQYQSRPLLATAGIEAPQVDVWDLHSHNKICTFDPVGLLDADPGMCMAVKLVNNPHSLHPYILALYENGKIIGVDLAKPEAVAFNFTVHRETGLCLDISPDGKRGVSGGADDQVQLWSVDFLTHQLTVNQTFTIPRPGVSAIKIRGDGLIFATGGWDHTVRVFGFKKPKPLAVLRSHTDGVSALSFARVESEAYGDLLASGSGDARVALWSLYPPKKTS